MVQVEGGVMEYEITIYDDAYDAVFVSESVEVDNFIETATEVVRAYLDTEDSEYSSSYTVEFAEDDSDDVEAFVEVRHIGVDTFEAKLVESDV